jgi:hypothetical protein
VAQEIAYELAAVFETRELAREILSRPDDSQQQMAEMKALTSSIDASAGVIQATADILLAM